MKSIKKNKNHSILGIPDINNDIEYFHYQSAMTSVNEIINKKRASVLRGLNSSFSYLIISLPIVIAFLYEIPFSNPNMYIYIPLILLEFILIILPLILTTTLTSIYKIINYNNSIITYKDISIEKEKYNNAKFNYYLLGIINEDHKQSKVISMYLFKDIDIYEDKRHIENNPIYDINTIDKCISDAIMLVGNQILSNMRKDFKFGIINRHLIGLMHVLTILFIIIAVYLSIFDISIGLLLLSFMLFLRRKRKINNKLTLDSINNIQKICNTLVLKNEMLTNNEFINYSNIKVLEVSLKLESLKPYLFKNVELSQTEHELKYNSYQFALNVFSNNLSSLNIDINQYLSRNEKLGRYS